MEAQAAETYGWDTVFAIPVPLVNRAIVDHGSSPAGFSQGVEGATVSASFGDWQLAAGGDGRDVRLSLPLSGIDVVYEATGKQLEYPSGSAVIEVGLHYIPHGEAGAAAAAEGGGTPYALVVKDAPSEPQEPIVSLVRADVPNASILPLAAIESALLAWCTDNLGAFAHVFAVVDLDRMIDQGEWAFVTPTYTSYAYLDGATLEASTFAVLTMCGGRSGAELADQLSPNAIPPHSVAGFLVSQARTLEDLVRPAICQAYPGLTTANFTLSPDGSELALAEGASVALAPVTHEGETYYPRLTSLTVRALGETIQLDSSTETPVGTEFIATCSSTHWYGMTLGRSSEGQTIAFAETRPKVEVQEIEKTSEASITQIIVDIAGAIVLVVLTVLTDGAALIAGGLVIGLLLGANHIVPTMIERANKEDSPGIDLLLANAVAPIRWTGGADFTLDAAGLAVAFQLGGDPRFA
jgi:Clostridium P-47 protein